MILFLISFILVFVSSYLLASIFSNKRYLMTPILMFLIAFAQIVFSIELLSIFNAISKSGILALNALFLTISLWYWNKNQKPIYIPQIKTFFSQAIKAMKKDKMLFIMGGGFLFFIAVSVFLCWFMPVVEYDALAYHFNRALQWVSQGSLAHFDIADDRNINMAINSEILYSWLLTFVYRNVFMGFFSFAGYLLTIFSLYSLLEQMGYSMRRRLWTIFLTSSIAGILFEASSVQINIIISGLILACVSLFYYGVKKTKLTPIYFSSLAISLAVGTKTSAFFVIPSLAIIFTWLLIKYQKENFWKYTGIFIGFSCLNTLIFSAYNYILNFIEFGNFMGTESSILYHKMKGGVQGYISGLIRHLVLLLDFTGFTYGNYLQNTVFICQDKLLTLLNIPLDLNVISSNENQLNWQLNDSLIGGGIISILVLIPCSIISIIRAFFAPKNEKIILLGLFGISLFICIAVMSAGIGFMLYSSRFINTFLALSAPVMAISYIKSNKNIFKYIILFYVMSYFIIISTHMWGRHFVGITKNLKEGMSIREMRTLHMCSVYQKYKGKMPYCALRSWIYSYPKDSKIGIFTSEAGNLAVIKLIENDGYKIDFLLLHKFNEYNLKQYDYLIFTKPQTVSSFIKNKDKILNNYYFEGSTLKFKNENEPQCVLSYRKNDKHYIMQSSDTNITYSYYVSCQIPYSLLHQQDFKQVLHMIYDENYNEQDNVKNMDAFLIFKQN